MLDENGRPVGLRRNYDRVEIVVDAVVHGVGLVLGIVGAVILIVAASNELLRTAGRDCALYKSGILIGPRETRIRGRSGAVAVWLWRSDLAAQGGEGLSPW